MASAYTKPGTLRAGFDYQDIVAVDKIVDLIRHQCAKRYQWIRIEADENGYLDDIQTLKGNGSFEFIQVKFSTDPESITDPWDWTDLLKRNKSKKSGKLAQSLLMKWSASVKDLNNKYSKFEAQLVTNRRASHELEDAFVKPGLVDMQKIQDPKIRQTIIEQCGDEETAKEFFLKFHFKFDQPSLEDMENHARQKFEEIGGTEDGWNSLKEHVRKWATERNQPLLDGLITLEWAKRAARWRKLETLPQEFGIPSDFVIPCQNFHESFLAEIKNTGGQCFVLAGSPGIGKSTYLSHLVEELRKENIPCLRHHYFLSLNDRSGDRTISKRVAESLMADLEAVYPEAVGELSCRNPNPDHLGKWLNHVGDYFHSRDTSLVVIIDGLDHVFGNNSSFNELNILLHHMLPPAQGITIVFATQPIETTKMPSRLRDYVPRQTWKPFPLFDFAAVCRWVDINARKQRRKPDSFPEDISVPGNSEGEQSCFQEIVDKEWPDTCVTDLAKAFWEVSKGLPLHLHYSLRYIQEHQLPLVPSVVYRLPSCPHSNIRDYYGRLWDMVINEKSKQILHLMTACEFDWPQESIFETLDPEGKSLPEYVSALRAIRHLTKTTELGVTLFHPSLMEFVRTHEDHRSYWKDCIKKTLAWLTSPSAPEYMRWAHEWRLNAQLDNFDPLISGPSRSWAIDSVVKRFPTNEVLRILSLSCQAALQKNRLPDYLYNALLRDYLEWIYEAQGDSLELLLDVQLKLFRSDNTLVARLSNDLASLSFGELLTLARHGRATEDQDLARKILSHFQDRFEQSPFVLRLQDEREEILSLAALCEDVTAENVVIYILEQEDQRIRYRLIDTYSEELRRCNRMKESLILLGTDLNEAEKLVVMHHASLLALEQGLSPYSVFTNRVITDPYLAIIAARTKSNGICYEPHDFPSLNFNYRYSVHLYGTHEAYRKAIVDDITEAFFLFVANHIWGRVEENQYWLGGIETQCYGFRFLRKLDEVASDIAPYIKNGGFAPGDLFWRRLGEFEKPDYGYDAETWDIANALKKAATRIAMNLILLGQAMGYKIEISQTELQIAFSSGFSDSDIWIKTYLAEDRKVMTNNAVRWVLDECDSVLKSSIALFPDRSLDYARMAKLATMHGLEDRAMIYVEAAASNLLGYGSHKDILLFEALDAITECYKAGIRSAKDKLVVLVPAILQVTEFTDGDLTHQILEKLADTFSTIEPGLLPDYYKYLRSKEQNFAASYVHENYLSVAECTSGQDKTNTGQANNANLIEAYAGNKTQYGLDTRGIASDLASLLEVLPESSKNSDDCEPISPRKPPDKSRNPDPAEYPPQRFGEYLSNLSALQDRVLGSDIRVDPWVHYWIAKGQASETFGSLKSAIEFGEQYHLFDELFDLAVEFLGTEQAFDWLVSIHSRNNGWRRGWGTPGKVFQRWENVKRFYPEKCVEFMLRSIDEEDKRLQAPYGKEKIQRMIKYCLFTDQIDLAEALMDVVTRFVAEVLSTISLPVPDWVTAVRRLNQHNDGVYCDTK